jgi:hypothetical protein
MFRETNPVILALLSGPGASEMVDTPTPEEQAAYMRREEARFLRTFDPTKYKVRDVPVAP